MEKHPCEGCIDWVPVSVTYGGSDRVCDYIGRTGHARMLICPSGAGCTVKSTLHKKESIERYDKGGYPVKKRNKMGPPERIPIGKVRELAALGLSDAKIGKKIGFSKSSVRACRIRHNIPKGAKEDAEDGVTA